MQTATDLCDKVAIITGAGSGIGREIALQFAHAGSWIMAVDRDAASLETIGTQVSTIGAQCRCFCTDVSDLTGLESMVKKVANECKRIDILCNNAGISDQQRSITELDVAQWNRIIAVNLTSVFLLCKLVIPHMVEQGGGVIVNTASVAAIRGAKSGLAYTASKHGVLGITRSVAAVYGEMGIRCNSVSPGSIATNIREGEFGGVPPTEASIAMLEKNLLTRPQQGRPEQVASVVAFLASNAASYINGENIVIDAGWTVR